MDHEVSPSASDGTRRERDATVPSRTIMSLFVTGIVIAIVAGTFPDVGIQGAVRAATQPVRTITGLNQHWDAFSPNPRGYSFYIDGIVDFADGTSTTYPFPKSVGPGAYADYRWHKYQESLRPGFGEQRWPAYADYLAHEARAPGREPVRVTLIRRWSDTLPPGPGPQREPWSRETLFVLEFR